LDNLEYHIQGNHLLENGFSLVFGGYYFKGDELYRKGKHIVYRELKEQVLRDGAHFELSPMYHRIILYRVLDLINLVTNNESSYKDAEFESFLRRKASHMLNWLNKVSFNSGETPNVNDSTEGIIHKVNELSAYANELNIVPIDNDLGDSGYRMFKKGDFELFIDAGNIGPDYIPGHAHSDTFNFILHYRGFPVVVESGISTYDRGIRRQRERSTISHNTVRYAKVDQSEVWDSFRVGRRAKVFIEGETKNSLLAYHDGYKRFGMKHYRKFTAESDHIVIEDEMFSQRVVKYSSQAYFHFIPGIEPLVTDKSVKIADFTIDFIGSVNIKIKEYYHSKGFNRTEKAKMIEVEFKEQLVSKIYLTKH